VQDPGAPIPSRARWRGRQGGGVFVHSPSPCPQGCCQPRGQDPSAGSSLLLPGAAVGWLDLLGFPSSASPLWGTPCSPDRPCNPPTCPVVSNKLLFPCLSFPCCEREGYFFYYHYYFYFAWAFSLHQAGQEEATHPAEKVSVALIQTPPWVSGCHGAPCGTLRPMGSTSPPSFQKKQMLLPATAQRKFRDLF